MKAEKNRKLREKTMKKNKINRNREYGEMLKKIQSLKLKIDDTKGKRIKNRKQKE